MSKKNSSLQFQLAFNQFTMGNTKFVQVIEPRNFIPLLNEAKIELSATNPTPPRGKVKAFYEAIMDEQARRTQVHTAKAQKAG